MSGSTNFLVLNPTCANQESDAAYSSDTTRTGGYVTNQIVPSPLLNKFSYQASIMAAALAGMLTAKNYSPNDGSASPGTALASLEAVLANILTNFDRPLFSGGGATQGSNPSLSISLSTVPVALFTGILRISAGAHVTASGSAGVNVQVLIGSSVIAQYNVQDFGDFVKFSIDVALAFSTHSLNCYANVVGLSSSGASPSEPQLALGAYSGVIGAGTPITFQLATPLSGGNVYMDYLIAEIV